MPSSTQSNGITMDGLKKIRTGLKSSLTKLKSTLDGYDLNNIKASVLATHGARLMELASKFEVNNDAILVLCVDEAEEKVNQADFESSDEKILEMRTFIQECEQTLQAQHRPHTPAPPLHHNGSQSARITLPKLELIKFGGKLEEWMTFADMFSHAVDTNRELSGAQKLQYLKSALHGDAARLIESITITDNNYPIAWKAMVDRYQHKREIIHTHVMNIIDMPAVPLDSTSALRNLIDVTNQSLNALRVLKCEPANWNDILVTVLLNKLDNDTRRQYELTQNANDMPSFEELLTFLEQQVRALSAGAVTRPKASDNKLPVRQSDAKAGAKPNPPNAQNDRKCSFCKAEHFHFQCKTFLNKSVADRYDLVKEHRLCINCLRSGHIASSCTSGSCRLCQKKHHSTLHREEQKRDQVAAIAVAGDIPSPSQVLLATAMVKVNDKFGNGQDCRALVDPGSQATFISSACATRLGLKKISRSSSVSGISATAVAQSDHYVNLCFSSNVYNVPAFHAEAIVLQRVTSELPTYPVDSTGWKHIQDLPLADPSFQHPEAVDVLLGADILPRIFRSTIIRGEEDLPIAQDTALGWIIFGPAPAQTVPKIVTHLATTDVDATLRRFWELEDVSTSRTLTKEESECEAHFVATTTKRDDGSYQVRLPFKKTVRALGDSKASAIRRFHQLESRLERNPQLKEQYSTFMKEYLELGHMKIVTTLDQNLPNDYHYYLPHHCVIKEASTTTKLRVVFDASAKSSSGVSLNDQLMVGPVLQQELFSILTRWRLHIVPLCADIQQMYRHIWVHSDDCRFQRILWRFRRNEPLQHYQLLTVTYGEASAPFQAVRTLFQLASDYERKYPLAAAVVRRDFYMDDVLTGESSIPRAIALQSQLMKMMSEAKFTLRKWSSSVPAVLETLPENLRETQLPLTFDADDSIKTLGLFWMPSTDEFKFTVQQSTDELITKRIVLSQIAKVFDPLGLISPVTIRGKLLMQTLWKLEVDWDDALKEEVCEIWSSYRQDLLLIAQLRIPRCIAAPEAETFQLHGFSDASERAYAAALYLRTTTRAGNVHCQLICSKTKVAPTKQISLPRLELCGAVLLSRLVSVIREALPIPFCEIHGWTDSTVVKYWLSSPPQRWKTFIANRVTEVQEIIPPQSWHHIKGTENPADLPTRGIQVQDLIRSDLWFHGPAFLREASFPFHETGDAHEECSRSALLEERNVTSVHIAVLFDVSFLERYSSLGRLQRTTALLLRVPQLARAKKNGLSKPTGPITVLELRHALHVLIRVVQGNEYAEELKALSMKQPISTHSKILPLCPILDHEGLLRVGGRLRKSHLPYHQKHPLLLPRSHTLTRLIVEDAHRCLLHGGPQLVLFTIQQRYWIVRGKDLVRSVVRRCKPCVINRAQAITQQMADLPERRVTPSMPFSHVGVDYAGPVLLRNMKGRKSQLFKAYICVYVCFSTKAVHLELVSDLSSSAFIAALHRFTSRRGKPVSISSDNGTNFVGANRELQDFIRLMQTQEHNEAVSRELSQDGIQWIFNPPASPHMGGLWEAGVKFVKHHIRRTIGETPLNFEEYVTLLAQVESCLNSRPLCPAIADPNDLTALSPGHFLTGRPLVAIPEPNYTHLKVNRLSRWQHLQYMQQHFWNRWSQEYLTRLQQRPKWKQSQPNMKEGDLVVILDEQLPPNKWKMARIVELHPGSDGQVRVVSLKTPDGVTKRPVVKLCRLPMEAAIAEESESVV